MDKRIKLGFWNYIKSGKIGKEAVDDWKEHNFNIDL